MTPTRGLKRLALGAAAIAIAGIAALAAIQGRGYVLPDDVKRMAGPVLAHRLMLSTRTRLRARDTTVILQEVLDSVPVPVEVAV